MPMLSFELKSCSESIAFTPALKSVNVSCAFFSFNYILVTNEFVSDNTSGPNYDMTISQMTTTHCVCVKRVT